MKRFITWGANAALLCASLLFTLVLAEVALRVSRLGAANTGVFTVTEVEFEQIPGIWGPGQGQLVLKNHELPYRVRTNRLGYRGADFTLESPKVSFESFIWAIPSCSAISWMTKKRSPHNSRQV